MMPKDTYTGKSAYHGCIAANYDRDRVGEPVWQREQDWFAGWVQGVPAGAQVLDVPAGTGRFIGMLRTRGARVHAVDISEDMLAELRQRWPGEGLELVVERADAEALPYAAGQFDFVVCWRLFHLLPPAASERVLRELARVCRGEILLEVFGVELGGRVTARLLAFKSRVQAWLRPDPAPATPWGHITNYPQCEPDLQVMFARCGLQVIGSETLADYHGRPARIYRLKSSGGAGR